MKLTLSVLLLSFFCACNLFPANQKKRSVIESQTAAPIGSGQGDQSPLSVSGIATDGSGPSGWCGFSAVNSGTKTSIGTKSSAGGWSTAATSIPCQGIDINQGCPTGYTKLQFGTFTWNEDSIADTVSTCIKNPTAADATANAQGSFCGASVLNSGNRYSVAIDGVFKNADIPCQGKKVLTDGCPANYTAAYFGAVAWGDDSSADYVYTCIRNSAQTISADFDRRGAYCGFALKNSGNRNSIVTDGSAPSAAEISCEGQSITTQGCPAPYQKLSIFMRSWHDDSIADELSTCISTSSTQNNNGGSSSPTPSPSVSASPIFSSSPSPSPSSSASAKSSVIASPSPSPSVSASPSASPELTDGIAENGWCGFYGVNSGNRTSIGLKPTTGSQWDQTYLSIPCLGKSLATGCPTGYSRLQFGTFAWSDDGSADTVFTCIKNGGTGATGTANAQGMFCGATSYNSGNRSSVAVNGVYQSVDISCQGKRVLTEGCPAGYRPGYFAAVAWSDDSSADYIYTCVRDSAEAMPANWDHRGEFCGVSLANGGNRYAIALNGSYSTTASVKCEGKDIATQGCPKNYKKLQASVRSWSDDSSADTFLTCVSTSVCSAAEIAAGNCHVNGGWNLPAYDYSSTDKFVYESKLCDWPEQQGNGKPCSAESGFSLVSGSSPLKEVRKLNQCVTGYALVSGSCVRDSYALKAIYEQSDPNYSSMQANNGWYAIFSHTISAQSGDILRIHGQAELTNDNTSIPVAATIALAVNGNIVSMGLGENVVWEQGHHQPFWVDTVYNPPSTGNFTVEVWMIAARGDSNPWLTIEGSGYGHLVTEHYRKNSALTAGEQRYGLVDSFVSKTPLNSQFGGVQFYHYPVASSGMNSIANDLFRVNAQTLSNFANYDQNSAQILANGVAVGKYATQNNAASTYHSPNWTDAVYTSAGGVIDFQATMHGALGLWNNVAQDGVSISGLQFRADPATTTYSKKLIRSEQSFSNSASIYAIGGDVNLINAAYALKAGDVVRLRSQAYFSGPDDASDSIFCDSKVYTYRDGALVSASARSYKYVNALSGALPLYNDDIVNVPSDGTYTFSLYVSCISAIGSGFYVPLNGSSLIVDQFGW